MQSQSNLLWARLYSAVDVAGCLEMILHSWADHWCSLVSNILLSPLARTLEGSYIKNRQKFQPHSSQNTLRILCNVYYPIRECQWPAQRPYIILGECHINSAVKVSSKCTTMLMGIKRQVNGPVFKFSSFPSLPWELYLEPYYVCLKPFVACDVTKTSLAVCVPFQIR